jgi:hypothetical protein
MSLTVREILAPLDPHKDRIVRTPMTDAEIDELERQAGVPVPTPFREYLKEIGLFQDLTWGASPIEVYDRVDEFARARRFLDELLPGKHGDLLPFGEDGAGNYFALGSGGGAPYRIHFVDHETQKVSKQKPFEDWLQAVVAKALRGIKRRPPNERKAWCVQFSLPNLTFEDLRALLSTCGTVRDIDADWTNRKGKPSDVITSERRFELEGEALKALRLEYKDWSGPQLSFDMRERLVDGPVPSRIRQLHRLFQQKCPGYRLVDYGALDVSKLK